MRTVRLVFPALIIGSSLAACGGDEASSTAPGPPSNAGSAGAAGSSAGAAGSAAGKAGSAGTGQGGKAGTTSGGSSGSAGIAGSSSGSAGAGGLAPGACAKDADCVLPPVTPAGCVKAVCTAALCVLEAVDVDGDGHATKICAPTDPKVKIAVGDDCDDANKDIFPGAWDGPAVEGKPNRCGDAIDQDCSGADGDSSGAKGESCTCTPGDTQTCDQDASGKPITFPGGKPLLPCASGTRTCVIDGITKKAVFGPCIGAVAPALKEICNGGIDDDCDGKADMADSVPPENLSKWSYDADDDGFAPLNQIDARIEWCNDAKPTVCPKEIPSCDLKGWKLANLPGEDCDDTNDKIRPTAVEKCNGDGKDYDCNGTNNLPTSGQCACLPGDEVACSAPGFEYPIDAPSDAYPLQEPPVLAGVCKWGKKKCNASGQWDACSGGVGRASLDCGVKDVDRNCNGVVDASNDPAVSTDCVCTNGAQRPCEGTPKGLCTTGTETCVGGAWNGVCVGAVGAKNETCDGYDEDCDGVDDYSDGDTCIQTLDVAQQFFNTDYRPAGSGVWGANPSLYLTAYATRTGSNVRVQMRAWSWDGASAGYGEGEQLLASNVDSARYDWYIEDGGISGSDRFPGINGGDLAWKYAATDTNGLGNPLPWLNNNCSTDPSSDKGIPMSVASSGGKTVWEGRYWGWSRQNNQGIGHICKGDTPFAGGNNQSYLCGQAMCAGLVYATAPGKGIRIRLIPK